MLDAVQYCLTVQETLVKAKWSPGLLEHPGAALVESDRGDVIYRGLRVRMGIHMLPSNESVVCREHPVTHRIVYAGKGVYVAQDVADAAAGGQILLSNTVHTEIKPHLSTIGQPKMMPFSLLQTDGEAHQLYQIVPAGLPQRLVNAKKS